MPTAETASLIVDLKLRDQLSGGIAAAKGQLAGLDATATKTAAGLGGISNAAQRSSSALGGLGSSLGNLAKVGATAFVAFKTLDFFADSLKAASEEEAGIARLTASLRANIPAWDGNSAAVERAVKANERFGFSDGEVRDSLALLIAATHDTAQAYALIATAQDLARLKGVSLKDASQALVTIEAGRFRGLAQLGIQLKEGATQEEALAAVRAVAAGQAAAFGATTEGAMQEAGVAVQNLQEDIGQGLAPIVKDLAVVIRTDVIPAIRDIGGAASAIIGPLSDARVELAKWGINLPDFIPFIGDTNRIVTGAKAAIAVAKESLPVVEAQRKAALDYVEAQNAVARAVDNGTISEEEGARQAAALDEGLRNLAETTRQAGRASLIAAEQQDRLSGVVTTVTSTVAVLSDTEIKNALAAGQTAEAHARLNDILGLSAGHFGALSDKALAGAGGLDAETIAAQEAAAATFGLNTELANLPRTVDIDVNVNIRRNELTSGFLPGGLTREEPGGPGGLTNQEYIAAQAAQKAAEDAAKAAGANAAANRANDAAAAAAQKRANELAAAYRDKVSDAFDAAKRRGDYLFDALHDRHIKAIKDAENLAQKQHDASLQAISDELKVQQAKNAAPVNAAEQALRDRQQAQSRRDLVEAQQRASAAVAANRDPAQSADLLRSLRAATEALVNFDAQAAIDRLKVVQSGLDAKAQGTADTATQKADAELAKAKVQAQKDADKATIDDAKQKERFEQALAQLKDRDIKAGKTPKQIQDDISALERRFGITTDAQGRHHIDDPLTTAIKSIKIPAPHITNVFRPPIYVSLNGRDVRAALTYGTSPAATSGVRSGQAGRQ